MGDTETLAKAPGAVILSIGMVAFDPVAGTLGASFYSNIDPDSCKAVGLVEDASTVEWWANPLRDAARATLEEDRRDITQVLTDLSSWWAEVGGRRLWCQGPSFDQPILDAAYRACWLAPPWEYNSGRDTRTIYELTGEKAIAGAGTFHNALDDARSQAEAVIRGYRQLGLDSGDPDRKPIRVDLAIDMLRIAGARSTIAEDRRPLALAALDFLIGTYEPLEDEDTPTDSLIQVGKPMPYFCPACQAIPRLGHCNLAGCPTAPAKAEA